MKELVDMLRTMAGVCRSVALRDRQAHAQAVQYVNRGSMPGIRVGLGDGIMLRLTIERESNVDNAEAVTWNTLWVDPTEGDDHANR